MAIVKGFLRPKFDFNLKWFLSAIIIATAFSFVMYMFFYFYREFSRMASGLNLYQSLVVFNDKEEFLYNLFYGMFSAVIGFYIFIILFIQTAVVPQNKESRFKYRSILNDQRFHLWTYFPTFLRLASLIGVWFMTMPIQFDLNLMRDFYLLYILIPLVLFLNVWPKITRVFGKKAYLWMVYSLVYIGVLGFAYANINFIDTKTLNYNLTANRVLSHYHINYPSTHSFQEIDFWENSFNFYVILENGEVNKPKIFAEDLMHPISIDSIINSFYFYSDVNLHIDKDVKLEFVNRIKEEFRKSGITSLYYSTIPKNTKYPPEFPMFKYLGLRFQLEPIYSLAFVEQLDSIDHIDKNIVLRLPYSDLYRIQNIKKGRFLKLGLSEVQAFVNGLALDDDQIRKVLYHFIKEKSPEYQIIFEPNESITYEWYIHYLDLIYSVLDKLRNELAIDLYHVPFEEYSIFDFNLRKKVAYDKIVKKYPINIIEWSPEEKRLIEIIKKTGYYMPLI